MYRIIPYRGFEIHVALAVSAEDLYDVTFQIKGGGNLGVLGARAATVSKFITARSHGDGLISLRKAPGKLRSTHCLAP